MPMGGDNGPTLKKTQPVLPSLLVFICYLSLRPSMLRRYSCSAARLLIMLVAATAGLKEEAFGAREGSRNRLADGVLEQREELTMPVVLSYHDTRLADKNDAKSLLTRKSRLSANAGRIVSGAQCKMRSNTAFIGAGGLSLHRRVQTHTNSDFRTNPTTRAQRFSVWP